jgi:hypothetical protein
VPFSASLRKSPMIERSPLAAKAANRLRHGSGATCLPPPVRRQGEVVIDDLTPRRRGWASEAAPRRCRRVEDFKPVVLRAVSAMPAGSRPPDRAQVLM